MRGPSYVACGVCGAREVATLSLGPGYVRCEPRDVPPGPLPPGAVRGHYRWAPEPERDETIRIWCSRHGRWLVLSKFEAVAAAKNGAVVRAFASQRV